MNTQTYATANRTIGDGTATISRSVLIGRILSGVGVAALAMDAVMKIVLPQVMIDNSPPLGLPATADFYRMIGAILLVSLVLHLVPRTKLLGAILVTAFLGGAVAVNLRVGLPLLSNTLFGVYVGAIIWAGLYLRSPSLRAAFGDR